MVEQFVKRKGSGENFAATLEIQRALGGLLKNNRPEI